MFAINNAQLDEHHQKKIIEPPVSSMVDDIRNRVLINDEERLKP